MSMKQPGQKTYKTAQGKLIDMDLLRKRNELTPAVGNAKVNARGDELGPGGQIIRKREDIVNEYYKNTNVLPNESTPKKEDKQDTDAQTSKTPRKKSASQKDTKKDKKPAGQQPSEAEAAEWEEDENGDFIKKEK